MNKQVALHTLGCKVNQYDTESIAAQFREHGYDIVDFNQSGADVYIINTCTVTNMSDRKSRQMIRRAHRRTPNAKIVVVGCYAQTDSEEVIEIPGVNLVIGTDDRKEIVGLIESLGAGQKQSTVNQIALIKEFEELEVASFEGKTRAFLKIQDGCNQFCSYCKVPYARGRSRSRKISNVLNQVSHIVDQGYREIVLTGVHLGAYGQELNPKSSLKEIVESISSVNGITRVRISSVDPNEIEPDLIRLIKDNPNVCRHLHIPLQSGSDSILEKMRRCYRTQDFTKVVNAVRESVPGIAITTDVIVGFPGETPELFQETYEFLKTLGLAKIHVFKYSPRSGTVAAKFPEQVPHKDKEARSQQLINLSNQMAAEFHQSFINQEVEILVETNTETGLYGLTDNYLHVTIPEIPTKTHDFEGQLVRVKLKTCDFQGLAGILI